MDTQEVKDAFIEMTKKLIRQVTDERELQNVRPELLQEIRENVRSVKSWQDGDEFLIAVRG